MGMQLQAPQPVRCLPFVRHLASVVEQAGQAPQVELSAQAALVLVAAALSTIAVWLRLVVQAVLRRMLEVQAVRPRQLLRASAGMELLGNSRAASTTARRRRSSTVGPVAVVVHRLLQEPQAAVAVAEGAVSGLLQRPSTTMVVSPLTVVSVAMLLVSLRAAVVEVVRAASSALELCPQTLEPFRLSVVSVVRPPAQAELVSVVPLVR